MGETAGLIWPEAIESGGAGGNGEPPELHERYLWPHWRMQFEEEHEAALEEAGCGALLAVYMADFDDEENRWTSPAELGEAAQRMKALVLAGDESVASVVELYEIASEDGSILDRDTPPRQLFLKEMDVLVKMAEWAQSRGISRVAIEIG